MSKKGPYVLFIYSNGVLGIVKKFLSTDLNFYVAASTAFKFKTKQDAKKFYQNSKDIFPIATQCFIRGPKGGIYRMSEV